MTCRHMYEEKPTGMCWVCQPDMFPTLKELDAGRRWMAEWNEYAGNVFKHEDPPPAHATEVVCSDAASPAAASPEPDRTAEELVRRLLRQRADELGVRRGRPGC